MKYINHLIKDDLVIQVTTLIATVISQSISEDWRTNQLFKLNGEMNPSDLMRSTISQCRQQSWKHYFKPNIMFSSRKTPVARPRWHHFVLCNHLLFILIPQDLFLHLIPLQGDCNIYHIFIIIYIYLLIYFYTWYLSRVMAIVRKTLAASPRWQQHSATW